MRHLIALIAASVSLAPAVALADVAPPSVEEMECRRGAVPFLPEVEPGERDPLGRPARPWPYCTPSTCASDDDCSDGRVCSEDEISFCVESHGEGENVRRTIRARGCEPDGTCLNVDSTCETSRRCVDADAAEEPVAEDEPAAEPEAAAESADTAEEPETPPAQATQASGCGCRVGGTAAGTPWGVALLALALWRQRRP